MLRFNVLQMSFFRNFPTKVIPKTKSKILEFMPIYNFYKGSMVF
jgi:hypothetical protein